jgi:putative flippase GtrA
VSGTVVAYFINKFWTFKQNKKSVSEVLRFAILYFLTFLANVGVNKMALNILTGSTIIAFLFATATSTLLNFIGQKYWVFKKTQTL